MKVEILKQKGYRFLWINDYLWMWDIPIEQKMQKKIADECYGDVLIAGYGLGIVQRCLTKRLKVNSITTIEKYPEVTVACQKEYGKIYGSVIHGDFYNQIPSDEKFDCIIGDIWEEITPENLKKYKRFKNKAKQFLKPNGKIFAWGKDYFEYLIKEKT